MITAYIFRIILWSWLWVLGILVIVKNILSVKRILPTTDSKVLWLPAMLFPSYMFREVSCFLKCSRVERHAILSVIVWFSRTVFAAGTSWSPLEESKFERLEYHRVASKKHNLRLPERLDNFALSKYTMIALKVSVINPRMARVMSPGWILIGRSWYLKKKYFGIFFGIRYKT